MALSGPFRRFPAWIGSGQLVPELDRGGRAAGGEARAVLLLNRDSGWGSHYNILRWR